MFLVYFFINAKQYIVLLGLVIDEVYLLLWVREWCKVNLSVNSNILCCLQKKTMKQSSKQSGILSFSKTIESSKLRRIENGGGELCCF